MPDPWLPTLSIPAAILPTAVYVLFVWWIDRYEKEPWRWLVAAFLWGAFPAVAIAIALQLTFDIPLTSLMPQHSALVSVSIVGPLIEEAAKAAPLVVLYALARHELDGPLDGIIYGSLIGFGFAMTENLLYFWSGAGDGVSSWGMLVLGRAVVFGLNHAMFTSLFGIGLTLAAHKPSASHRWGLAVLGLSGAVTAHFFHNFFLSVGDYCLVSLVLDYLGVGVVLVTIVLAWRREKRWLQTFLSDEVEQGLLSAKELAIISSWRRRTMQRWRQMGAGHRAQARAWNRLVHDATDLAFQKRQYTRRPNERLAQRIEALRQRIQEERRWL
jgi:protease PrsW